MKKQPWLIVSAVLLVAAIVVAVVLIGQKNDLQKKLDDLTAQAKTLETEIAAAKEEAIAAAAEAEAAAAAVAAAEMARAAVAAGAPDPALLVPGPKLGDVRVRQALLYALDRENFILAEYGSPKIARVGLAPFSPTSWAFPDESELNAYPYDLEKAAAMLDETGWLMGDDGYRYKDGEKLSLKWLVYHDATWPGTLSAMAFDSWKQIGVDLNIELMDFNTVQEQTGRTPPFKKDFDIYTMGFSLDVDPDITGGLFDYNAFVEGGFNSSGYYNQRAQELIKLGKESFDQEERKAYYNELALLLNDEVPTSIVAYRSEVWGINKRVTGLNMNCYLRWAEVVEQIELEGDQTLKFAESSFDGMFMPIMYDNVYDAYINTLLFDKPIKPSPEGVPYSDIAAWELSNENKTYTFTLKDGIKYTDGSEMTAEDFAFTYMMIAHPEYTGPRLSTVMGLEGYDEYAAGNADTITGIKVIDDKTISFTFKDASPANIWEFQYAVMSKAYYEADTWEAFLLKLDQPMGSGQFKLEEYHPGQMIMLARNDDHWNKEKIPNVEAVYITIMQDPSKIPALQLGEIDFAQIVTSLRDNVPVMEAMENIDVYSYLGNGYTYMCFNTLR